MLFRSPLAQRPGEPNQFFHADHALAGRRLIGRQPILKARARLCKTCSSDITKGFDFSSAALAL